MSKTYRDISLLKKSLEIIREREIQIIDPKALDKYLSEFIVKVTKRDGGEYEPTTLRAFVSSLTCDTYNKQKTAWKVRRTVIYLYSLLTSE